MGSILPYLPNFTQIVFYLHAKNQQNFAKKFKKKIEGLFFCFFLIFWQRAKRTARQNDGRKDKQFFLGPPTKPVVKKQSRDYSFNTFAKFSEKLTFLKHTCAYQGVWNFSFSEIFAYVLNEWSLI